MIEMFLGCFRNEEVYAPSHLSLKVEDSRYLRKIDNGHNIIQ